MTINPRTVYGLLASVSLLTMSAFIAGPAAAAGENSARHVQVINFWTAERRAAAIPRDLVIDARGLGYLRRPDGSLLPHGHQISALKADPAPRARPGGGGGGGSSDSTPPTISNLNPDGQTIGLTYTFSATVEDASGVKSATFFITDSNGLTESFPASNSGGNTWSVGLTGFTNGPWSWHVEARDNAKRGGNLGVSSEVQFSVSTGGGGSGGGSGGNIITNSQWTGGGDVQTAVGRLYFQMPSNARLKGPWNGYVCSGTVVSDGVSGRSVILTASHCVYDDANKAFARNVLFIPNQANTTGSGTDTNCGNDPLGCWVASFGVVDVNWTTRVFPDNIPWDYGFYVVADTGAHQAGTTTVSETLDSAVPALTVQFTTPFTGTGSSSYTHALGYSYSDDPNFMYCAEEMTTEGADNWWLPSCGLSGGSSGGSWIQPLSNGSGPIISVNSWGYTTSPGMAGPKLSGTSAQCVMDGAITNGFEVSQSDGQAGYAETCP